jgi:capsular exopolysaccharide synthesis family protein
MINFSQHLWKPQEVAEVRQPASLRTDSNGAGRGSDLSSVPVVNVQVEPESRIALITDPRGPGADRFRFLRMRLREVRSMAKLKSLVITSPLPGDGKSTVAMNLATALADKGRSSVLLVEADLHHPTVARSLGIEPQPGLADCLQAGLDPISALRRLEPLSWHLMQAGEAKSNPTELIQSDALSGIFSKLSSIFDWILFDTPPVTPLTDALILSRQVDASLLVVRADSTPREMIEESLARLGKNHVLGVIFNAAEGLNHLYSKYYGYYGKK